MRPLRFLVAAALLAAGSAHAIGKLADITIQDRTTGRELPVVWHEGRAFVVGRPGNEYQVNVRNRRGEDVLAIVSVDGVNVVSGETANVRQSGYVIAPWQRMDIRGWRKSLGEIASFYFTSLGDSYASRTGRPDNVGVIGVAVFRRKPVEPPPSISVPFSQNEPYRDTPREKRSADSGAASREESRAQAPSVGAAASAPLGTGHGRREESQARWVAFDRASDTPAETITIYYDSYRNLVARGILSAPVAPRHPDAFPGFVPDPA
jgi:hypothetical protein